MATPLRLSRLRLLGYRAAKVTNVTIPRVRDIVVTSTTSSALRFQLRTALASTLMIVLIVILALAGGASRADVGGQLLIAITAPTVMIVALLLGIAARPADIRVPAAILAASVAIVAIQLVPLPPGLWRALPGRQAFVDLPVLIGVDTWRPIALAPDATFLALTSLMVPAACLYLLCAIPSNQMRLVLTALVGAVLFSAVLGVLQFSASGWENPLVNASAGEPSGIFANRNHQALFLSIGIVLITVRFLTGQRVTTEAAASMAVIALLVMSILATGSRAGLLVGSCALLVSTALTIGAFRHSRPAISRIAIGCIAATSVGGVALLAVLSVTAGRSRSFERLVELDATADFRTRALPTVMLAIKQFFPVGSGFGTFDPVFRIIEPDALLKLTYFNHAHNDFLEIALEGGLLAMTLMLVALAWIVYANVSAWRRTFDASGVAVRGAGAILGLILIASIFDYPVRTPMIMAVLAIASAWLAAPDRWWRPTEPGKLYRRAISS